MDRRGEKGGEVWKNVLVGLRFFTVRRRLKRGEAHRERSNNT
jgi:hypothetical protein